eukprot:jgi/Psemu1/193550/e_gw1.143.102.1
MIRRPFVPQALVLVLILAAGICLFDLDLDSNTGVAAFANNHWTGTRAGLPLVRGDNHAFGFTTAIAARCVRSAPRARNDNDNDSFHESTDGSGPVGTVPSAKRAVLAAAAALWIGLGAAGGAGIGIGIPPAHASSEPFQPVPEYLSITDRDIAIQDNKKLVDFAVGTINTQFYDNSGGARFNPSDFYRQWKEVQKTLESSSSSNNNNNHNNNNHNSGDETTRALRLDTRDGTVQTLKYLVSSLEDPYSKYMTREELRYEFKGAHDGFLGTGAYIEIPKGSSTSSSSQSLETAALSSKPQPQPLIPSGGASDRDHAKSNFRTNLAKAGLLKKTTLARTQNPRQLLTSTKVANLPVVTAVAPNSPAERAGLVVGDRIVAVGDGDTFVGYGRDEIRTCLETKWGYGRSGGGSSKDDAEKDGRYFGVADLTIAKPVYSYYSAMDPPSVAEVALFGDGGNGNGNSNEREIVLGYRSTKLKLPTKATDEQSLLSKTHASSVCGNVDAILKYPVASAKDVATVGTPYSYTKETQTPRAVGTDGSANPNSSNNNNNNNYIEDDVTTKKVGYIRLTRFSKSSTEGYLEAVRALESEDATSYVIDLRNNYGGVIQEAMLTASTLLGDPHAILCYLLNARGGFTPVDVESYAVDPRYPGYLLSHEPPSVVVRQVMREHPTMFRTRVVADWDPPSSYASIHEQVAKRGIHRISYVNYEKNNEDSQSQSYSSPSPSSETALRQRQRRLQQKLLQKDVVLLINEGTASSAEFFAAALQDNGRSVAVVGTKSFGKGLIQHTFPMPDGGGLKLTIGEFLRPSLRHVTNVFDARFYDKSTGEFVGGGGIRPDVYCDSKQGIPGNPRADLCVGVALDVLEEHESSTRGEESALSSAAAASYPSPTTEQSQSQSRATVRTVGAFAQRPGTS